MRLSFRCRSWFWVVPGGFAVSETAITAAYVVLAQVVLLKISLKSLVVIVRDAMVMVDGILLILAVSLAFTNCLVDAEIPQALFAWVKNCISSPLTFLLALNLASAALIAILDIFSALVILIPDCAHGRTVWHPPCAPWNNIPCEHANWLFHAASGYESFYRSYRFNRPITELYRATLPFMLVLSSRSDSSLTFRG